MVSVSYGVKRSFYVMPVSNLVKMFEIMKTNRCKTLCFVNKFRSNCHFLFPFLQDCVQVPTDGKRSSNLTSRNYGIYDGSLTELNPPISSEIKDGQWLGVEVKSQGEGGKVIVCAHR